MLFLSINYIYPIFIPVTQSTFISIVPHSLYFSIIFISTLYVLHSFYRLSTLINCYILSIYLFNYIVMYSSYHNSSLSVMPILTVNWLNSAIFLIFTLILLYYHTQHSTLPIILIVIVYVCDLSLEINEYCFIEFFYNSQSISYNCLF